MKEIPNLYPECVVRFHGETNGPELQRRIKVWNGKRSEQALREAGYHPVISRETFTTHTEVGDTPGSVQEWEEGCWVITRMPSTGSITNIGHSQQSYEETKQIWSDSNCVEVLTNEEYNKIPTCEFCGDIRGGSGCYYCRP